MVPRWPPRQPSPWRQVARALAAGRPPKQRAAAVLLDDADLKDVVPKFVAQLMNTVPEGGGIQ